MFIVCELWNISEDNAEKCAFIECYKGQQVSHVEPPLAWVFTIRMLGEEMDYKVAGP